MPGKEQPSLSRRRLIGVGLASFAAGSGITALAETLLAPPENIVAETVAKSGLQVVNLFLKGGLIKNNQITKGNIGESANGLSMVYFTSNIPVMRPTPDKPHIHIVDFRTKPRYSIEFTLPLTEYQRIMADKTLTNEQKNENISRAINFLMVLKNIKRGNNSDAVLYNRMLQDQNGNWTNSSTHHTYSETTDQRLIRRSRSSFKPFDPRTLQTFVTDVDKIAAAF